MNQPLFILSQEDWSLHRKGEMDQERHKRKVKEAIKNNLADIVSEESIILSEGDRVLKVPVRSMDEPKLRFDYSDKPQVGQGQGGTKVGDVLGRANPDASEADGGQGKQAGDQPGADYYEAEITVDELAEIIFEDLQLPRLKQTSNQDLTIDDIRFNDVRKQGMMGNVDKRRTLLEALKRQALSQGGGNTVLPHGPDSAAAGMLPGLFSNEDLRFKTWEEIRKPQSSAVVLAMMDTSGSMGSFEKYIARSFFFWMVRFLRTKYTEVGIRFLAHHTEAREVGEEAFFSKGESGGTMCSSVYRLALELVERNYLQDHCNVYAFHFSDGDNYDSDNQLTSQLVSDLVGRINMLGYGEIRRQPQGGRLWESMSAIRNPGFIRSVLREKGDVYRTLKSFFGEELTD